MVISFLVFLGTAAGILVGSLMWWIEPERLGPFAAGPYLFGLLVLVIPNLLFMGSTFFAVAVWTRSLLLTYLGVVVFFVGYAIAVLVGHA